MWAQLKIIYKLGSNRDKTAWVCRSAAFNALLAESGQEITLQDK